MIEKEEVPYALFLVVDTTIIFIINGNEEGSGDTDREGESGKWVIQCIS